MQHCGCNKYFCYFWGRYCSWTETNILVTICLFLYFSMSLKNFIAPNAAPLFQHSCKLASWLITFAHLVTRCWLMSLRAVLGWFLRCSWLNKRKQWLGQSENLKGELCFAIKLGNCVWLPVSILYSCDLRQWKVPYRISGTWQRADQTAYNSDRCNCFCQRARTREQSPHCGSKQQ